MLATPPDAAGYLLFTRDVGLHHYLPPVETPLSRAPWLYLARETETPFTPTVSLSIDARDTPQMEMSVQRQPSAAAGAPPLTEPGTLKMPRARRLLSGVVGRPPWLKHRPRLTDQRRPAPKRSCVAPVAKATADRNGWLPNVRRPDSPRSVTPRDTRCSLEMLVFMLLHRLSSRRYREPFDFTVRVKRRCRSPQRFLSRSSSVIPHRRKCPSNAPHQARGANAPCDLQQLPTRP